MTPRINNGSAYISGQSSFNLGCNDTVISQYRIICPPTPTPTVPPNTPTPTVGQVVNCNRKIIRISTRCGSDINNPSTYQFPAQCYSYNIFNPQKNIEPLCFCVSYPPFPSCIPLCREFEELGACTSYLSSTQMDIINKKWLQVENNRRRTLGLPLLSELPPDMR